MRGVAKSRGAGRGARGSGWRCPSRPGPEAGDVNQPRTRGQQRGAAPGAPATGRAVTAASWGARGQRLDVRSSGRGLRRNLWPNGASSQSGRGPAPTLWRRVRSGLRGAPWAQRPRPRTDVHTRGCGSEPSRLLANIVSMATRGLASLSLFKINFLV